MADMSKGRSGRKMSTSGVSRAPAREKSQIGSKPRMIKASTDESTVTIMGPNGNVMSRKTMKISK